MPALRRVLRYGEAPRRGIRPHPGHAQEPRPRRAHGRALHLRSRVSLQDAQRGIQALLPRVVHPRAYAARGPRIRRRRARARAREHRGPPAHAPRRRGDPGARTLARSIGGAPPQGRAAGMARPRVRPDQRVPDRKGGPHRTVEVLGLRSGERGVERARLRIRTRRSSSTTCAPIPASSRTSPAWSRTAPWRTGCAPFSSCGSGRWKAARPRSHPPLPARQASAA